MLFQIKLQILCLCHLQVVFSLTNHQDSLTPRCPLPLPSIHPTISDACPDSILIPLPTFPLPPLCPPTPSPPPASPHRQGHALACRPSRYCLQIFVGVAAVRINCQRLTQVCCSCFEVTLIGVCGAPVWQAGRSSAPHPCTYTLADWLAHQVVLWDCVGLFCGNSVQSPFAWALQQC